jgi:hypothetical protein
MGDLSKDLLDKLRGVKSSAGSGVSDSGISVFLVAQGE